MSVVPLTLFADRPSPWNSISTETIVELLDRYDEDFDAKLQSILEKADGLGAIKTDENGLARLSEGEAEAPPAAITKAQWEPLQKEWFGDKYAAMQPVEAVRARCSDDAGRIIALESKVAYFERWTSGRV